MFITTAFAASESSNGNPANGETHSETGVAHDEGHSGVFPPFDSTTFPSQILWLAITFGLFYLLLKKTIVPRISGILEVRRDRIAQDLDQAANMKQEADEAIAAYEQELADARARAGQIGQEARDAAKAEADEERRKTEQALDAKLAEAEQRISGIKADAMKDVGAIAEDTAAALVEQLVGKSARTDIAKAVKAING